MDEMNFTTSTHDMTTAELLSELRRRNVKVWAAGDRLRYSVGDGVVPAELQELLTRRGIPDLHNFIAATRGENISVGLPGHTAYFKRLKTVG